MNTDVYQPLFCSELILTPNRRLSMTLLKDHQTKHIQQGSSCWSTPLILPFTSWLEKCWTEQTALPEKILLTAAEEYSLWEKIILASPESQFLLQLGSTIQSIQSAWRLLKEWQVSLDDPALSSTHEGQLFQQWAIQYQYELNHYQWLDRASLLNAITTLIKNAVFIPPSSIALIGFLEYTPAQESLIHALQNVGSTISQLTFPNRNQSVHRVEAKDKETEIHTLASWSKETHEHSPTLRIGCIIPDLDSNRNHIQRAFERAFSGHHLQSDSKDLPYNISAGKKLTTYPVVHTAFMLLQLYGTISIEELSYCLRSPFLGHSETEQSARALVDLTLRQFNHTQLTITDEETQIRLLEITLRTPSLHKRLQQFFSHLNSLTSHQSPSEWVNHFSNALALLGWPGERSLNSEEYQIIQLSWLPLLNEFKRCDRIHSSLSAKKAKEMLYTLADKTIFQPQSPDAPIQILGLLEAAGLSFDKLWIMGLDDLHWPKPPSPNPFIPTHLQKKLAMPNASAERELHYSRQLMNQLLQGCTDAIVSHASQEETTSLRPSTLIAAYPRIENPAHSLAKITHFYDDLFHTQILDTVSDSEGPTVNTDQSIPGGTALFKLQAACPFKAFSELRLKARAEERPSLGLKATERGKLIHKILELFWKETQSSAVLHQYSDTELDLKMTQCIDQAWDTLNSNPKRKMMLGKRYTTIEKKRLHQLINQWLAYEKQRMPFTISELEKEQLISFNGMRLTIRVDRIDTLTNAETVIIDYKTSVNHGIKAWFGERPDEPQLPLYAVIEPNRTAIAFAEIHTDSVALKGVSKEPMNLGNMKAISDIHYSDGTTWDKQIQHWQHTLSHLAHQFYQGNATVDPKYPSETCRYCHLHSLCRIYETTTTP